MNSQSLIFFLSWGKDEIPFHYGRSELNQQNTFSAEISPIFNPLNFVLKNELFFYDRPYEKESKK